jgi:nucleotide-binding universal stress UspA family protein
MKRLLCPIDFSEVSLNALEFAVVIGEKENSNLTLLNIFTPKDFNTILGSDHVKQEYDNLLKIAETKLQAISNEIWKISNKKGLKSCDYKLMPGKIVDVLSDLAKEDKSELIVIGTTGHSAYERKYLGGKAEKIIQHTHCSVLCVPENHGFHGIKKIVYATDYQEEDKLAIQQLIDLAKVLKAEVEILHVSHHDDTIDKAIYEEFKGELMSFVNYDKISFNRVVFKDVAQGLDEYMEETDADLLVLLNKKLNFLKSLFHRSLTQHLDKFTDYPLMILKL